MATRMLPPVRHGRALSLLAAATAFLIGCAGELENPERFSAPSMSRCTLDIDVQADIFGTPDSPAKCGLSGCHGTTAPMAALDLVSPGVEARLIGVEAQCMGLLIDPTDVENSILIRKLLPSPSCGARMPFGGMLTEEEIECVRAWTEQAVAAGGGDGGAPSDGGGGGGDDGGAGGEDAGAADGGV